MKYNKQYCVCQKIILLNIYIFFSVECFDLTTKQWKFVAPMSNPRRYVAVGVIGSLLYAVGGYDGNNVLDSVEVYDPKTDQWNYAASMKNRRRHVALGVLTNVDLGLPSSSNKPGM